MVGGTQLLVLTRLIPSFLLHKWWSLLFNSSKSLSYRREPQRTKSRWRDTDGRRLVHVPRSCGAAYPAPHPATGGGGSSSAETDVPPKANTLTPTVALPSQLHACEAPSFLRLQADDMSAGSHRGLNGGGPHIVRMTIDVWNSRPGRCQARPAAATVFLGDRTDDCRVVRVGKLKMATSTPASAQRAAVSAADGPADSSYRTFTERSISAGSRPTSAQCRSSTSPLACHARDVAERRVPVLRVLGRRSAACASRRCRRWRSAGAGAAPAWARTTRR